MQIQVENTPNPLVKKFTVGGATDKAFGPYDDLNVSYKNIPFSRDETRLVKDAEQECPLAAKLLELGVFAVTLNQGPEGAFVSVGVREVHKPLWPELEEATVAILDTYLGNGKSAFTQAFKPVETQAAYHARVLDTINEKYGAQGVKIVKPILTAIEAMSPAIKGDGGSLKFQSIDFATNQVFVEMSGACSGCSKTGDTLGNIESALKEYFDLDIKMVNTAKMQNPGLRTNIFTIN